MKLGLIAASILATLMGVYVVPATALMEAISIYTMVQTSDSVVRGEVRATEAHWSAGGDQIVTRARIRVDEDFKGELSKDVITIEYPGGEIDGLVMMVSDSVQLTVGEDVIIFLEKDQKGLEQPLYFVVGSAQGKYAIGLDGNVETPEFLLEGNQRKQNRPMSEADLIRKIKDALE